MRRNENSDALAIWRRLEDGIAEAEEAGDQRKVEALEAQVADLEQHGGYVADVELSPFLVRPKQFFDLAEMANFSTEWLLLEYFKLKRRQDIDRYLRVFMVMKDEQQRYINEKHAEARKSAKKAKRVK